MRVMRGMGCLRAFTARCPRIGRRPIPRTAPLTDLRTARRLCFSITQGVAGQGVMLKHNLRDLRPGTRSWLSVAAVVGLLIPTGVLGQSAPPSSPGNVIASLPPVTQVSYQAPVETAPEPLPPGPPTSSLAIVKRLGVVEFRDIALGAVLRTVFRADGR